jgi:hypothetical protein
LEFLKGIGKKADGRHVVLEFVSFEGGENGFKSDGVFILLFIVRGGRN